MADFRKLLFVLIAGALLFTTVASAEPFNCVVNPTQTFVRYEAIADYVGDIVLNCTGTVDNAAVGIKDVNIRLTIDTPGVIITSNPLSSATPPTVNEATLILNEGFTAAGRQYIGYSTALSVPMADGSQNVYQAVSVAANAVEWQGVVVAGPNSNPFTTIRLTNVRVNPNLLPVGQPIVARVNITSPTSFPMFNSNNLTVANIIEPLIFSVDAATFNRCVLPSTGESVGTFNLKFKENYGPAFKRIGQPGENNFPGGNYQNQSGFTPVGGTTSGNFIGLSAIGQADTATLLLARITGIPLGVSSITGPAFVDSTDVTGLTTQGMRVKITYGAITRDATTHLGTALVTGTVGDPALGPPYYGVAPPSTFLPDLVTIPVQLVLDYTVPAPRGTVTAGGAIGPVSTVGVMSAIAPEPRFWDTRVAPDPTVFTFSGICHTLLLFPYLTNQAGFDTGIVISNTSVDPLGTAHQDGACTLNYYGFVGAHLATPVLQSPLAAGVAVSPVVPAGAQLIMLLSAGAGSVNPMGPGAVVPCVGCAPVGFQGYMIASCDFQFAHGFAFISDLGASKLAQGYLALVIPERFYPANANNPPLTLRQPQFAGFQAAGNQGEQLGN